MASGFCRMESTSCLAEPPVYYTIPLIYTAPHDKYGMVKFLSVSALCNQAVVVESHLTEAVHQQLDDDFTPTLFDLNVFKDVLAYLKGKGGVDFVTSSVIFLFKTPRLSVFCPQPSAHSSHHHL